MLTGKAVSRAVRGHLLVDAALNTILVANAYNVPVPTNDTTNDTEEIVSADPEIDVVGTQDTATTDLTIATELFEGAVSSTIYVEDVCSADVLARIQSKLNEEKKSINMRTAILWVQYLNMVDILRRFLKAE
ncbi:MAG: hypothetical protein DSY80_04105 [Desulfocapsa sp.]|nr:MAG: hypothetical protein DSY80_04105 [Desulfocapsa sp.]